MRERIREYFPHTSSIEVMHSIQDKVAEQMFFCMPPKDVKYVAAVDCAYTDDLVVAGCVLMDAEDLEIVETSHSIEPFYMDYAPTLLSFREGFASAQAVVALEHKPDVLLVNGVGINHPRRAGLATHLGVCLEMPTIGITKRPLCGTVDKEVSTINKNGQEWNYSRLFDGKEHTGYIVWRKGRSNITIAPGHMIR